MADQVTERIVARGIPFTCTVAGFKHTIRSLWLWSPRQPDDLVITFLEGDGEPKIWRTRVELLEGGLVDDLQLIYTGDDALLVLNGTQSVTELRGPAEPLFDVHLDIQVAKSSATFEEELRGLIDD